MRVIAGSLKGRRLLAPPEGECAIRPTSDRAREALFSILQAWPTGSFVDLFGGTGAVAVEAWSRGYAPVACVERDAKAIGLAEANARGTAIRVIRQDVQKLKADAFSAVSLVFADPPYELSAAAFTRLAPMIRPWLATDGLLVWETEQRTELPCPEGFRFMESRRYGAARFHFFQAG